MVLVGTLMPAKVKVTRFVAVSFATVQSQVGPFAVYPVPVTSFVMLERFRCASWSGV